MDSRAVELGYHKLVLKGDGFDHAAYFKPGSQKKGKVLHVYLEGDGTPWMRKRVPAADPTPRNPLMLELMTLDQTSSLYLGRPCYHSIQSNACKPEVWTDGRYSEAVVKSMSAALDFAAKDYSSLVLMGYSGGGTLAMLLAERQPKVSAVVTMAANLDTERWSKLHSQPGLMGSLNPAKSPPLKREIKQIHIAGEEDENVPPWLVSEAIKHQYGATFKVYPGQDHGCCWREVWTEVLGLLNTK